jgi:hypothetical protein
MEFCEQKFDNLERYSECSFVVLALEVVGANLFIIEHLKLIEGFCIW